MSELCLPGHPVTALAALSTATSDQPSMHQRCVTAGSGIDWSGRSDDGQCQESWSGKCVVQGCRDGAEIKHGRARLTAAGAPEHDLNGMSRPQYH